LTAPTGGGRVRVPADVERPDRILAGLTARQLAILAAAALVIWAGYAATRRLLPLAAYAAAAAPVAVVAVALALGRVDGQPAARFAAAAVAFARSARRLVPAPQPMPPAPARLAAKVRPAPATLRLPLAGVAADGVVDLGPDGMAVVCRARAVTFGLRSPAEQEAMVAGFARWLNSLAEPVQVVVRAEPVDLSPAVDALESAAPGLPHPALEAAARQHAAFLVDLAARGLLARRVVVVLRHPGDDGAAALARRAVEAAASLGGAGVTLEPLDRDRAAALLARAFDPSGPAPVSDLFGDEPVTAAPTDCPGAAR